MVVTFRIKVTLVDATRTNVLLYHASKFTNICGIYGMKTTIYGLEGSVYMHSIYIYIHTRTYVYICVCDTLMKITEASCGFLSDSILVRQKIGYQRRRRR